MLKNKNFKADVRNVQMGKGTEEQGPIHNVIFWED